MVDDDNGIVRALVAYLKTLTLPDARAHQVKLAAALPMQSAVALRWGERLPGIAVAAALALAAGSSRAVSAIPWRAIPCWWRCCSAADRQHIRVSGRLRPGLDFTKRYLLRLAVVLVGFRITTRLLLDLGAVPLAVATSSSSCCSPFCGLLARRIFKLDHELALLVAVGSAVCGAAAILAVAAVTRARDKPRSPLP